MSDQELLDDAATRSTRRLFLKGAGASAVVVGLAACSDSEGADTSTVPTDATRPAGTEPADPPAPETTAVDVPTTAPPPNGQPATGEFSDLTKAQENWNQPAPWVQQDDRQLVLRVVENQHGLLFSYHGTSPGPTIRVRGDQTLRVRVENDLGPDAGLSTVGYSPGALGAPPSPFPGPEGQSINVLFKQDPTSVYGGTPDAPVINQIPTTVHEDWCLGEHINGVHSAHVTNMHTHGLHVTSGRNEDQTHSDNIYLRIVPTADWARIQETVNEQGETCVTEFQEALSLKQGDIVDAQADFEFILGRTENVPVHPPGTHWYHPHSHGSTHNQVASGMAGFLLIEGDVDEAVNEQLAGTPSADPGIRTGPRDYREREMFIQRVFNNPGTDPDRDRTNLTAKQTGSTAPLINGEPLPTLITMRPGAVERWRVLNGSVDGSGFLRFMVLEGRFEVQTCATGNEFVLISDIGGDEAFFVTEEEFAGTLTINGTAEPISERKQPLWQLSRDGVTLVTNSESDPQYHVKDLDLGGQAEPSFSSREECYDGENAKLCYNRPREVALADANRADVFFEAPQLGDDKSAAVYTVVGMPTALHATSLGVIKEPTVVAHVVVKGKPVDAPPFDFGAMSFPPVPEYLWPIPADELTVTPEEQALGAAAGFRSRTIRYAGWGHATSPRIDVPPEEVAANPLLNKLLYYQAPVDAPDLTEPSADKKTLVPITDLRRFGPEEFPAVVVVPNTRTMSINGHKFEPTSDETPVMWVDTAEEWAVYNESVEAWSINVPTDVTEEFATANAAEQIWYTYQQEDGTAVGPLPWGNPAATPVWPNDVAAANEARAAEGLAPLAKVLTAGADHPFHIHQNPFWLMRLEVPNNDGDLINVLDAPIWADVTFLPRNGGRALFRSRFMDFVGEYVNHCHILLHEDNGMMQRVRVLAPPADPRHDPLKPPANYDVVTETVGFESTLDEVNAVYAPPTPAEMYRRSASFIDNNNSGQTYPLPNGWIPDPPAL